MNGYLIPANSKRSQLIFSLFRPIDLGIFLIGVMISVIMLLLIQNRAFATSMMALLPALIAIALVSPIPNHHNVLVFLTSVITFFINRQRYIWKGWCFYEKDNLNK